MSHRKFKKPIELVMEEEFAYLKDQNGNRFSYLYFCEDVDIEKEIERKKWLMKILNGE